MSISAVVFSGVVVVTAGLATPVAAQVLKQEPPMGQLREGETVLVDDGTCPKRQIKQVVGGNHVKAGGFKHVVRTHKSFRDRAGPFSAWLAANPASGIAAELLSGCGSI